MTGNFHSLLSPYAILAIIGIYFLVLIIISGLTGKNTTNSKFFLAGRSAPWILVSIGMIGASLSGVTFISVPGKVGVEGPNQYFSYLQFVFGNLAGYLFIGSVLLPLYYKHNLTSIYGYLEKRLGFSSYKTGAAFFLISRGIGSALRFTSQPWFYTNFVLLHWACPSPQPFFLLLVWFMSIRRRAASTLSYTPTCYWPSACWAPWWCVW